MIIAQFQSIKHILNGFVFYKLNTNGTIDIKQVCPNKQVTQLLSGYL